MLNSKADLEKKLKLTEQKFKEENDKVIKERDELIKQKTKMESREMQCKHDIRSKEIEITKLRETL